MQDAAMHVRQLLNCEALSTIVLLNDDTDVVSDSPWTLKNHILGALPFSCLPWKIVCTGTVTAAQYFDFRYLAARLLFGTSKPELSLNQALWSRSMPPQLQSLV